MMVAVGGMWMRPRIARLLRQEARRRKKHNQAIRSLGDNCEGDLVFG